MTKVTTNQAGAISANVIRGVAGLSNEATVLLFRCLVLNERVSPSTDLGKELISAGTHNPIGGIRPTVARAHGKLIAHLVKESGALLAPMSEPTTIHQLGHKRVKGQSKVSAQAAAAEKIMRETAFMINPHVLGLAATAELSKEDHLVLQVCLTELLPPVFYFPVSYDYRGRMYYRGGIFTPQGGDMLKGLLQFAESKPLGKYGFKALCYALADAVGYKGAKDTVEAYICQELNLEQVAAAPTLHGFQASGLAQEIIEVMDYVNGTGNDACSFMSRIVCHQDATCSGLQIASAITGHRETAVATNCTASGIDTVRSDVYGDVAHHLAHSGTYLGDLAAKYGRDMVKYAVMTLGYGAGLNTIIRDICSFLIDVGELEVGPHTSVKDFRQDWELDKRSKQALASALEEHCGATTGLLEQLREAIGSAPELDHVTWTTADGFEVIQSKQEGEVVAIGSFSMEFDKQYDVDLNAIAICPNLVHSIDACQMRQAVVQIDCPVACVHDSLGTRAGDYYAAAVAVRKAFVTSDPRGTAVRLLNNYDVDLKILGNYDPREAMRSAYFWC